MRVVLLVAAASLLLAFSAEGTHGLKAATTQGEGAVIPNATISLSSNLFNSIIADIRPIVVIALQGLNIPGAQSTNFAYSNITFSTFDFSAFEVTFEDTNRVRLALKDLSLAIPATDFTLSDTSVVSISCSGTFAAVVTRATIRLGFDLTTLPNGSLQLTDVVANATFGGLNFTHTLDGQVCNLAQDVIRQLYGSIDALVEKTIKSDLPALLSGLATNTVNKALGGLAIDFTSQPWVEGGDLLSLSFDVASLLPKGKKRSNTSGVPIIPLPVVRSMPTIPDRDIVLSVNEASVDELLAVEAAAGKIDFATTIPTVNTSTIALLLPGASALCPECPLNIGVDVSHGAALRTDFTNDTFAIKTIDVALHLNAVAKNGTIVELAILAVNATADLNDLSIKNDTIYFTLAVPELDLGVVQSNAGPLNGPELSALLSLLLNNLVIPKFNKDFKGIVLPIQKNGMGLVRTRAVVSHNYFILAADIKL